MVFIPVQNTDPYVKLIDSKLQDFIVKQHHLPGRYLNLLIQDPDLVRELEKYRGEYETGNYAILLQYYH